MSRSSKNTLVFSLVAADPQIEAFHAMFTSSRSGTQHEFSLIVVTNSHNLMTFCICISSSLANTPSADIYTLPRSLFLPAFQHSLMIVFTLVVSWVHILSVVCPKLSSKLVDGIQ